jgi:hypothetical protein
MAKNENKAEFRPISEAPEGWVGISEATNALGVKHAQYTRRLVLEGRLDTPDPCERFQGKGYSKWLISPASIAAYKAKAGQRSGLRRYTLRAEADQEQTIRDALNKALGQENFTLEFSYQPKAEAEAEAEEAAE